MALLPVDIVEHDNGSENNMISINCIALPAQALIKKHSKEENLTIPDGIPNFVHSVQKTAVQELLTVIAHATTLFISMFAEKKGLLLADQRLIF